MKSNLQHRIVALETAVRRHPTHDECVEAQERLRCRFTLLQRDLLGAVRELMHEDPLPDDIKPPAVAIESMRRHEAVWALPLASEKSPAEAMAFLGEDSAKRFEDDIELLAASPHWGFENRAGHWDRWRVTKYADVREALERWHFEENGDALLRLWFEQCKRHLARLKTRRVQMSDDYVPAGDAEPTPGGSGSRPGPQPKERP